MNGLSTLRGIACSIALLFAASPACMAQGVQPATAATVAFAGQAPGIGDAGQPHALQKGGHHGTLADALSHGFEDARRTPAVRRPARPRNPLAKPPVLQSGPVFQGGGIR